jgi:excisionase family DNA binding protein
LALEVKEVSVTQRLVPTCEPPVFYSVAEAARLFRLSEMTLYRAINGGEFPAVRIRGRLVVPAGVISEMTEAALEGGTLVDASAWCRRSTRPQAAPPRPASLAVGEAGQ